VNPWEHVARLGAEFGPEPPADLIPTAATFLATVVSEPAGNESEADPDIAAPIAALFRLLGRTPRPWCGPALDTALAGLDPTWAPAQAVRLAAAVAVGLLAGHLPPGLPWALHVDDPVGAAGPALAPVFDLLGGLLDSWDPTLAPPEVTTNLGGLRRAGTGYRRVDQRLTTVPDLWIELQITPPPAQGPSGPAERGTQGPAGRGKPRRPVRDVPTVVVRPAPAGTVDPGPPPAPGLPPKAAPALTAAGRWCFSSGGDLEPQHAVMARLFTGSWPVAPDGPSGSGDPEGRREVADLVLADRPDDPAAWCSRALVEATHPAGSRTRHARLIEAAASAGHAAADLRRHARALRATRRGSWGLDVWVVADAALETSLAADVMSEPAGSAPGELALALAARVEAASVRSHRLVSGQTGD